MDKGKNELANGERLPAQHTATSLDCPNKRSQCGLFGLKHASDVVAARGVPGCKKDFGAKMSFAAGRRRSKIWS